MPVFGAVTNQFEAELHEGDYKLLGLPDGARGGVLQSHAGLPEVPNASWADSEQLRSEKSLGCARGVLWAFIFEAALVIAVAVYWKLHLSPR